MSGINWNEDYPDTGKAKGKKKKGKAGRAHIRLDGKLMLVQSPYSAKFVEEFRKLHGVWDTVAHVWKFPFTLRGAVINILSSQGFKVRTDEVLKKIEEEDRLRVKILAEIREEDKAIQLKEKERPEKYGINKSEWMVSNVNTPYWKKLRGKRIT